MTIEIKTNKSLSPDGSVVIINGITYKDIESLQLRLAKNEMGELTIQHATGFLEAYKAEANDDL